MTLYFQHQPEIKWLLHVVMEVHYNTTTCFFAHFPLPKSSVPNGCQTSHESLVINDGLLGGQQVQFQTETEFFSLLACPNQSCGAPPPHAEGHKGVKQTLTATNCQCNLTYSPPVHHSPPQSVKFRNTCRLIYTQPTHHPCMVLRLNINQKKCKTITSDTHIFHLCCDLKT